MLSAQILWEFFLRWTILTMLQSVTKESETEAWGRHECSDSNHRHSRLNLQIYTGFFKSSIICVMTNRKWSQIAENTIATVKLLIEAPDFC